MRNIFVVLVVMFLIGCGGEQDDFDEGVKLNKLSTYCGYSGQWMGQVAFNYGGLKYLSDDDVLHNNHWDLTRSTGKTYASDPVPERMRWNCYCVNPSTWNPDLPRCWLQNYKYQNCYMAANDVDFHPINICDGGASKEEILIARTWFVDMYYYHPRFPNRSVKMITDDPNTPPFTNRYGKWAQKLWRTPNQDYEHWWIMEHMLE